jgi:peptidoglycan L-alanyl-D-glutamate endopeptidase CwlK
MAIAYGPRSRVAIATLDGRLQRLLDRYADDAPPELDLTITEGHRGEAAQNAALASGASTLAWPQSKHNTLPARAFDFVPYPFAGTGPDWRDLARFARIAGALQLIAAREGLRIRWGGDWDRDGRTTDETFVDAGHIELVD